MCQLFRHCPETPAYHFISCGSVEALLGGASGQVRQARWPIERPSLGVRAGRGE